MEVKRGYKQTEVGVIPEDWEVKPIDKEIDLLTGFPFPSSSYSKTGIKLLRGSNIKRGVTDWSADITEYWEKLSPELKQYVLKEGDIVIAMDGSLVGRSFARLTHEDLPALLLQRVAKVRSSKIDSGYLKEFICSDFFTKHCDSVKTVTAIPHISPKDIKEFQIPLPHTKAEQTAIAAALSDADALIQSLEKLIAKKRNIKQGAMQELLKPKEGWMVKKLGEICEINMGQSPSSSNYNASGVGLPLVQGNADIADRKTIIRNYTSQITKRCNNGDIIMSVRAPVGEIALATFDACIGRGVCAISYPNAFLYHYLIFIEPQWAKHSTGSTFDSVNSDTIWALEINTPPPPEQTRIATILADMDAEISAIETNLSKYKQVKQGMMQNLLTGKIRLV